MTPPHGLRGGGGQAKNNRALAHPTHVRKLQTKFDWILSNSLGGGVTYNFEKKKKKVNQMVNLGWRPTGHRYFIGQIFFFKKKKKTSKNKKKQIMET